MARLPIVPILAVVAFASPAPWILAGCKTQAKVVAAPLPPPPPPAPPPPPGVPPPRVKLEHDRLRISPELEFDPAKPALNHTPTTDAVLAALLDALKTHPEITKLRVEAHTDNVEGHAEPALTATEAQSKALSRGRAEAVVAWLTSGGIDASRLVAKGWGSSRPIVPNDSEEHRHDNRRVEFHVLEISGAASPPEPLATATTAAPPPPPPTAKP